MRAFCSANAWLGPANTITAAKAETKNRTRRVKFMTTAPRLIAELSSGTLHAASDVAGGSGPSTRFANATPLAIPDAHCLGSGSDTVKCLALRASVRNPAGDPTDARCRAAERILTTVVIPDRMIAGSQGGSVMGPAPGSCGICEGSERH